jgi:hypothetical protein
MATRIDHRKGTKTKKNRRIKVFITGISKLLLYTAGITYQSKNGRRQL